MLNNKNFNLIKSFYNVRFASTYILWDEMSLSLAYVGYSTHFSHIETIKLVWDYI